MAAIRRALANRTATVFFIAILIVLHLLVVHGHEEVPTLASCLVLLIPLALSLVAGLLSIHTPITALNLDAAARSRSISEVWRLLPVEKSMVMRH